MESTEELRVSLSLILQAPRLMSPQFPESKVKAPPSACPF